MKVYIRNKIKPVGNHRGNKVLIDKKLPKKYHKPIILHEKMEAYLMKKKGMKYNKAHKIANAFEKNVFFKNDSKGWAKYDKIVSKIYRSNWVKPVSKKTVISALKSKNTPKQLKKGLRKYKRRRW